MKKHIITIIMLISLIVTSSGCIDNNADKNSEKNNSTTETATSVTEQKVNDKNTDNADNKNNNNDTNKNSNTDNHTKNSAPSNATENISETPTQTQTESVTESKEQVNNSQSGDEKKENTPQVSTSVPINIKSYTNSVSPGGDAFIKFQGKPETEYSISVHYDSGENKTNVLEKKTTDADGYTSLEWTVNSNATSGVYKIVISGDNQNKELTFTVME